MTMEQDRRRYSRAVVEIDVAVEAAGRLWQAKTVNLSPCGAKVGSLDHAIDLPPGTRVRMRIPAPRHGSPFSLEGTVERRDPDGMALSFGSLAEAELQRIRDLVRSLDNGRTAPATARRGDPSPDTDPVFPTHTVAMDTVKKIIQQVADTNATVLIRGESGVGKELVARAIHSASPRQARPFVKVNCAALPRELLESELFGHEKGAFTGAYRRKLGKFEFANHGTLFLDEVGELPLALQAKLLHVLQDHEFTRLGGRDLIRVDARIIAATNRDLDAALADGHFREDLYYRLNVVEIRIPPLRERTEEIPMLAAHFLEKFQRQYGREVRLPPEAMRLFMEYRWPGNIRELENIVRRLVVLGNVRQIQDEILARLRIDRTRPPATATAPAPATAPSTEAQDAPAPDRLDLSVGLRQIGRRAAREAEARAIREVLDQVRWNRSAAARRLKISYKTLLAKIAESGLAPKPTRPHA